jgi:UDPglucose 6-dehydrogenase|tara:strand:- start:658 stop:1491 length:834 start_codon:yes stop_codon:yes gene_type:complete
MIGIIGQGFVGNAVYQKFKNFYEVLTYDLDKEKSNSTLDDLIFRSETIFVCLPTPMNKNGSCDTTILEQSLYNLDLVADNLETKRTIIIKSTIPPGTTDKFNKQYPALNIVFNPEFLTERNAVKDFENQNRIIIGGPRPVTTEVKTIFSKVFPKSHIIKTDSSHAEMIKYMTNTFLATKISFANEIYQLCSKLNIDYDKVVEYATLDDRLGESHWGVPGHDGDLGFGGHCFPKDLAALLYLSYQYNTTNGVLKATQETNNKVRSDRDWERMKGRAVS